ncbi:MAG: radical SAM protein [Clostridia bacterium]|nr:radical SAM protein [Clostridia bacterium]
MIKGMIADIERAATHDGPGLRTVVFFKGCPLSCAWCHNPECIDFKPQILQYPEKCIGCGRCEEGCFAGARVVCGRELTAEEILAEILQDRAYYGAEGGVTFSGGEPLAQRALLAELIKLCRAHGIGCAAETSMIYYDAEIFQSLDLLMCDLKIWDSATHRRYTGVGNEQIIENIKKADELGVPILLRTPVIPEIEQGIPEIAAFARSLKNIVQYELLPYHPLGEGKRRALGLAETAFSVPAKERMKELEQYVFLRKPN